MIHGHKQRGKALEADDAPHAVPIYTPLRLGCFTRAIRQAEEIHPRARELSLSFVRDFQFRCFNLVLLFIPQKSVNQTRRDTMEDPQQKHGEPKRVSRTLSVSSRAAVNTVGQLKSRFTQLEESLKKTTEVVSSQSSTLQVLQ